MGSTAVVPVARLELDGYDWFERHAEILACQSAVDPEIVRHTGHLLSDH